MKHKKLWDFLIGAVLGTALGTAAIGCLVSAFGFSVSLWAVGVFCLLTAVLRSLPKGQYVAGAALTLITLWYLLDGILIDSIEALLFRLTEIYNLGYGWPVIRWSKLELAALDMALPIVLYLLGSLISLFTARAVVGKSCVPAVLLTLVTLGACFVVTDKVPATAWVFVTLFVGALLLLGSLLRKQNGEQATRLTVMLTVPVFLCVLLLFAFVPKNGYDGAARAEKWTEEIVSLWNRIMGNVSDPSGSNTVDLGDVGRQSYFHSEVLQVTAQVDGKLYLRGRTLDTYDGRSWTDSGVNVPLPWPEEDYLEAIGEVEITTKYVHRMLYLPYYTTSLDMTLYPTGKTNEHKLKKYSVSCSRLPDDVVLGSYYIDPYENLHTVAVDVSSLTALPDATRHWARKLTEEITGGKQSYYHIVKDIEKYVEDSAEYDLKTDRMPLGQRDFARWFLEEGETGYCVHFATAAAVLLRSAGIPARYVTGYMVDVKGGEPTVVTDADAHAWVEYWLPAFGWVVLEATPASFAPSVDTTETQPPPSTTAPRTETEKTPADREKTAWEMPVFVWWILGAAGVVLLTLLRRKVQLTLRNRRLEQGDPNEKALRRWGLLVSFHRYLMTPPETDCLSLAEKAKFSQYTISEEELAVLDAALVSATKQLKKRNLFLQLWYRAVLVLY